jgi:hypothetical protein
MLEGDAGGEIVIEHDICDAGCFAVNGDADERQRYVGGRFGVDEKKAIDAAPHEEFLIFLPEVGLAEVADDEGEEALLEEILFDAEHDAGDVALAELGNDDADGISEAGPQHASVKVGAVGEFFGGGVDTLLGWIGNGFGDGRVVEYDGHGCGREVKVIG